MLITQDVLSTIDLRTVVNASWEFWMTLAINPVIALG